MKNLSLVLVTSLMSFLLIGCDKDDDNAPVKALVIDTRQPSSANEILTSWIFLSDKEGKPQSYIQEVKKDYEIISFDLNENGPKTVTLLTRLKDLNTIRLNTIQLTDDMDTVNSSLWDLPVYDKEVQGNTYIDISDLIYYAGSITVSTGNNFDDFSYNFDNRTVFPFDINGEDLDGYISITRGNEEPGYLFVQNINEGDTLIPLLADFKEYDAGFDLQLNTSGKILRRVYGIDNTGAYCIFNANNYPMPGGLPIRYIDKFDGFETNIVYELLEKDNISGWIAYTEVSNAPLSTFEVIEPRADLNLSDDKNINYTYSLSAAKFKWTWHSDTDFFGMWNYIGEVNNISISQPTIPEQILEQIGFRDFDFRFQGATFYNYSYIKNYEEYVNLKQQGFELPDESTAFIEHYWAW